MAPFLDFAEVEEDVGFHATDVGVVGFEVVAVEIGVQSCGDGFLVVGDQPPELFELPFAPGERFGEIALEGFGEGCVGFLELLRCGVWCHWILGLVQGTSDERLRS